MASATAEPVEPGPAKPWLFWAVLVTIVVVDFVTKTIAAYSLTPEYTPHEIIGDFVRFTLAYNPGAAFGMTVGNVSRWVFSILTFIALGVLWSLYRATRADELLRTLALSLVSAGAIGNLLDRLRSARGVIDFIDVGVGAHRFWTFNVADSAVTVGAILLGWVLLQQDRATAHPAAPDLGR